MKFKPESKHIDSTLTVTIVQWPSHACLPLGRRGLPLIIMMTTTTACGDVLTTTPIGANRLVHVEKERETRAKANHSPSESSVTVEEGDIANMMMMTAPTTAYYP